MLYYRKIWFTKILGKPVAHNFTLSQHHVAIDTLSRPEAKLLSSWRFQEHPLHHHTDLSGFRSHIAGCRLCCFNTGPVVCKGFSPMGT